MLIQIQILLFIRVLRFTATAKARTNNNSVNWIEGNNDFGSRPVGRRSHIYIYIERERERDRLFIYSMYINIYIYIYIYLFIY